MLEIKNTQPVKEPSNKTTLQVDTASQEGDSMFDNMISEVSKESSESNKLSNNLTGSMFDSIISQVSDESLEANDKLNILSNNMNSKLPNVLTQSTQIDKLKFMKMNKDIINEGMTLEDIQTVSKNLNLDISKISKNDTKSSLPEFKSNLNDQMVIKAKLSSLQSSQNIVPIKDLNMDTNTKQELEEQSQVNLNTLSSLKEKIFDSKAKVQSFMSNIAKQMVENYRPPLTALKISLNPKELGSIDVIIRGNQNSLNISFQSNPVTMDILTQNQTDLRASLTKEFAQNQAFNFNFSQQNQNQDQNKNQFNNILFEDENIEEEDIVNTTLEVNNDIYI